MPAKTLRCESFAPRHRCVLTKAGKTIFASASMTLTAASSTPCTSTAWLVTGSAIRRHFAGARVGLRWSPRPTSTNLWLSMKSLNFWWVSVQIAGMPGAVKWRFECVTQDQIPNPTCYGPHPICQLLVPLNGIAETQVLLHTFDLRIVLKAGHLEAGWANEICPTYAPRCWFKPLMLAGSNFSILHHWLQQRS